MTSAEAVCDATRQIRASAPYDLLRSAVSRLSTVGPLVFVPNTGNWGDSLINQGARDFLNDTGHKFETASQAEVLAAANKRHSAVLLIAGNGGWCRHWHHIPEFLTTVAPSFSAALVLPTTYDSEPVVAVPPNAVLFARDATLSLENMPKAHFCHDMAFQAKLPAQVRDAQQRDLIAFRVDGESANKARKLPTNNIDLSLLGNHRDSAVLFCELIAGYSRILTDRLHVAIAGAMLGREVHMWPNDYGKSRAIFESSLGPHFENVTLHEWD